MKVALFMTQNVLTISKKTKIVDAVNLMKEHDIHRLPVVESNKLIGLVTESSIQEASPSKATSLSVFEMNYLLNKTGAEDVMIRHVTTIQPDEPLEEAVSKMRAYNVGVLPVVSSKHEVVGIITNNDIFEAFLELTGYKQEGVRISIEIERDEEGVLANITKIFAENHVNIVQIVVYRKIEKPIIVIQLTGAKKEKIEALIQSTGYKILSTMTTEK
ncbi:CBS domain-containing protein [Vagococcus entomophilus]|uniref:Acetoin utilization protein n=1 Tax=Vagococcus entomophilus TaxID=1160095 RepID=A0A430AJZ2_9ENTE|nr:CBS domain-containing protein [Vagococcus entomophilus]RSU08369.1 hypothetical protein CBF30_03785 [Vagococcus entomophilus]